MAVPQPARSSASASRPAAPARFEIPDDDGDKPNKGKKIAVIAGVVVAVGLAAFFGIPALIAMQNKLNVEREKNLEERDGGELGHLAELNSVLDATDPAKFEHISVREDFDRAPAGPRPDTTPVIPPTWTLSASPANIPNGRVNGMIAGGKFVADAVRLDPVGNRHLLTLRQGANVYADRELLIYLKLSPGEGLEGKTWTVTQDMRTGAPQVVKRWVADANRPPQSKPFPNGYAMVLEFGKFKDGNLPGKVFVALPDAEKTVVGGTFKAIVGVPERPEARLGLGMDE